jgi:hypothetical protein
MIPAFDVLAASVAVSPKVALSWWLPMARLEIVSVAVPLDTAPVPIEVPESENVTVPDVTGSPSETVAVSVNTWPCGRVVADSASVVVVGFRLRSRRLSMVSSWKRANARLEALRGGLILESRDSRRFGWWSSDLERFMDSFLDSVRFG